MKILLLGKNGQVGWELQRTLATLGEVIALGSQEINLAEPESIRSIVHAIRPNLIVNAAAYTLVDKAESEPELAMTVNGIAPGVLAEEAALLGASLIHYSTDYVFNGNQGIPYTEEDKPNPINIYGKTKLAGEEAIMESEAKHLIFRTSWVYSLRGQNFLRTMLKLVAEKDELSIVNDQFGTPNWARMIAEVTAQVALLNRDEWNISGTYHLTASGHTSWYGFAEKIFELALPAGRKLPRLNAISTVEYKTEAARPGYSVLDNSSFKEKTGIQLPSWADMLELVLTI